MALHARLMLRYPEENDIPVDPFAIVEMRLDDRGEYYYPSKVNLMCGDEVKFRLGQIERKYDRIRSIPFLIVAHIVESDESATYDILERLPEIRTWKCMVAWFSVVELVQAELIQRWSAKTAGYDGPFTAG